MLSFSRVIIKQYRQKATRWQVSHGISLSCLCFCHVIWYLPLSVAVSPLIITRIIRMGQDCAPMGSRPGLISPAQCRSSNKYNHRVTAWMLSDYALKLKDRVYGIFFNLIWLHSPCLHWGTIITKDLDNTYTDCLAREGDVFVRTNAHKYIVFCDFILQPHIYIQPRPVQRCLTYI